MSIQNLIDANKINIDSSFSDPNLIKGTLESVYARIATFRCIIDQLNDPGRVLNINYVRAASSP